MPEFVNNVVRLAFDGSLHAISEASCDAFRTRLVSYLTDTARHFTHPLDISLAISGAPIGPGATARTLPPPVMPVCLDRHEVLVGPVYVPGQSVCPECLDYWLALGFSNREGDDAADGGDAAGLPGDALDALAEILGSRLLAWANQQDEQRDDQEADASAAWHATAIRLADGHVSRHAIYPRRDCTRCAALPLDPFVSTVHCSRWTGIVSGMEQSAAPSAGAWRAAATWVSALPIANARPGLKRQKSFGRGRTPLEARQGCIGEALERYSLIYRGDERLGARAPLADVDAIHPDDVQLFSDAQYRDRARWNQDAEDEWWVPERFDDSAPVDWLAVRALSRGDRARLVPAACCLMWYQFKPGEPEFARADTIGCASGVTYDDALRRALLEWVERDAMAIWWDNRVRRPGLRVESFASPDLDGVRAGLEAIGRSLFLLDCTTDIGLPAYMAVAPRFDGTEPLIAGAADTDPVRAAYRAASEVGQVWYEARRTGAMAAFLRNWLLRETLTTQPWLEPLTLVDAPSPLSPGAAPASAPAPAPAWQPIVDSLEAVGLRAYAVDHSRADVVLHTVRAVVPGLRHVWNRRAPGRLYDVPVTLGWLARPTAEEDLNPIPGML
jgi:bacteriocin biosynthesis cyclodehydratase domain-containing protein